MKPERWQQIEQLYSAALEREPGRRAAFLDEACGADEDLRREVESLIICQPRIDRFIEAPAMDVAAKALAKDQAEKRGGLLQAAPDGGGAPEFVADSVPSKEGQLLRDSRPMDEIKDKPRKRAPWWMYAVSVAFLICAAVRYYAFYIQPEDPGIAYQAVAVKSGLVIGAVITTVRPDSAAARAGLQPGDLLLDSEGFFYSPNQPNSGSLFWETDHTYRLEIQRKEKSKTVFLTLDRDELRDWLTDLRKASLIIVLMSPLYLILAGFVAFSRPHDPAARWCALFLATFAISIIYSLIPAGLYSTVLRFPRIIGWLTLAHAAFCRICIPSVAITFFAIFPRRLFQRPWVWALVWLPALFLIPLISPDLPRLYSFQWPGWPVFLIQILLFVGYCTAGAVLLSNYLRLRNLDERRRVRIVVVGTAVAMIAFLPHIAHASLSRWDFIRRLYQGMPANLLFILACLGSAGPISMAYAILRHRLFDIRVMIRMGLRYAAARGALLSLVPIVGVVLAGDLMLHGKEQPLMQILGQRGWIYVVLAGSGFLLHIRRRVWLDALDRRFFREHYDAQHVLRAVVEEIREARSFEKVAPRVVSQVEAALHPEFAALLVRQPGEAKYQVLAAREKAPPPIPADSKLMGLVRVLGKPVEVSQSQTGWLSQLPQQETEFLRQTRLEWLFPICLAEGRTEALLVMGPKRSEEPYSREDQGLLQGITSSLAWLLEQSPAPAAARAGFEECPKCGTCYDSGSGSCKKEGAKLTPQPFRRLLARRYRFEQRLGEGGMGSVYQALDTELERHVAVKLIRPDLTASTDAVVRFKREAKAAASFTHPNVVTVYDFGMDEDRRAFLVMELLRGCTLRQELHQHGRLPATRALGVLRCICVAVDAAHQLRLLHRDLKPENIFLVSAQGLEIAKILDFGVVKPIAPAEATQSAGQTGSGMLVGTLKYMSPEQLRGEKPAESWDVWALSVVAYEMLAGTHPFAASTALDIRDAVLAGRVIPLRAHLPEAPAAMKHFFDQALSTRVELRPAFSLQLFSDFMQSIGCA